jgi:TonB family protein
MQDKRFNRWILAGLCVVPLALLSNLSLGAKDISVPNTEKGFDTQYHKFVDAYWKAKEKDRGKIFVQFAIPEHWFADTFGADHGPELEQSYLRAFDDFVISTAKRLGGTSPSPDCVVDLKTKLMESVAISVGSTQLPTLQRFVIHYESTNFVDRMNPWKDADVSWMDSFVYLDGAFRFYGKGGSSFLDPAKVRLADPCSKNGIQQGGKLIHRVEPVYPEQAKEKHVEGFVKMVLTVAPDGSVSQVKIIEGDPLLLDAAKNAAMQWKYEPFIQCGKPVEMQSFESVRFPPPAAP